MSDAGALDGGAGRPISQEGYRIQRWGEDPVWDRFDVASPRPGEVLVKVEACGIGLTVLNAIHGDSSDTGAAVPRVPGHELVGRVIEAGSDQDRGLVGQRVAAYFYLICGSCPECVAGLEDRCRRLAGYVGVHIDGGYAPFTVLPTRNAVVLPEGLDPVDATVIPDAVSTSIHVCRSRARVGPLDRVAVIGAGGGVGCHLVQVARLYGAAVAGLDIEDDKLAMIEELGALAVRSDDFERLGPRLWAPGGPTVVVDFVGSAESLGWAFRSVETGGRVVILTTFRDITARLDPRRLVMTEATILGSRYATRHEIGLAAELVADGRVRPIIGATTGPAGVPDIHERLRTRRLIGRGALAWG